MCDCTGDTSCGYGRFHSSQGFSSDQREEKFIVYFAHLKSVLCLEAKELSETICDGPTKHTADCYSIFNMFGFICRPFVNFYYWWENDNALRTLYFEKHHKRWTIQMKRKWQISK
jgi:hypothetical protein